MSSANISDDLLQPDLAHVRDAQHQLEHLMLTIVEEIHWMNRKTRASILALLAYERSIVEQMQGMESERRERILYLLAHVRDTYLHLLRQMQTTMEMVHLMRVLSRRQLSVLMHYSYQEMGDSFYWDLGPRLPRDGDSDDTESCVTLMDDD